MQPDRTLEDPDFGVMRHDVGDLWSRKYPIEQFGRLWDTVLNVTFNDKKGIESGQREAFRYFSQHLERVLLSAEQRITEYASAKGIESSKVFEAVTPTEINFPYAQFQPTFGILYDVAWDRSHGAAVKFVNGSVVEVGLQDIIL